MQNKIREKLKEAMIAKDEIAMNVYRGIISAFTNELVSKGKTPQDTLTEDESLAVIKKLAKQRKDSIEQFEKGGRPELAESEKKELTILETFLPQMMSIEEIMKIAEAKKQELQITDKSKMGQLMGTIIKEAKGLADGGDVKKVVEGMFL